MSRISHLVDQSYFVVIGDSKSAVNTYDAPLTNYLEGHTSKNWTVALRHANAGWTVANALAGLADALSAVVVIPSYVFVDLGANDVVSLPAEATWKANAGSLLDLLHTAWPSTPVYIAKVYRSTQVANCATLNGWWDDVIADGRSDWASIAFDEGAWLPDWTLDGTHPDARIGGYSEMARQWYTAIYPAS